MSGKSEAEQHESNSRKYLEQSAELHIINPASGLYEPKPTSCEPEIDKNRAGEVEDSPFYVSTRTHWIDRVPVIASVVGLLISALTLLFLIKTVDYAHKQWIEAKRTADASICASNAAVRAASAAEGSLEATKSQFQLQNRAYLIPGDPSGPKGSYDPLEFPVRNYGHVSAKNVTFNVHFGRQGFDQNETRLALLDRRVLISKSVFDIAPSDSAFYFRAIFTPNYTTDIQADIASGKQIIGVRGDISYDSGFGQRETTKLCFTWDAKETAWKNCSANETTWLPDVPNSYKDVKR